MSNTTPVRRSRRQRKSVALHDDQVTWDDAIQYIRAASNSPDRSSDSSGPELVNEQVHAEEKNVAMPDASDEGDESDASSEPDAAIEDSGRETQSPRRVGTAGFTMDLQRESQKPKLVPRARVKGLALEQGTRNRMFTDEIKSAKGVRSRVWAEKYGPEIDDLYPVLRSRDIWRPEIRDVLLPSRKSVKIAMDWEAKGKYLTSKNGTTIKGVTLPANVNTSEHAATLLSESEFAIKCYTAEPIHNDLVTGPFEQGSKSTLHPGVPQAHTETSGAKNAQTEYVHRGWFINLGATPSCMAWGPITSDAQYLAIAIKCTSHQRATAPPRPTNLAPAFAPSPDYPTHIEIWCTETSSTAANFPARLDRNKPPKLTLRLGLNFGNILQMQWLTSVTPHQLALLTSDGAFRIVTFDLAATGTYLIRTPLILVRPPPQTIFTAFTFASHQDLILSSADGTVHLYNTATPESPYLTLALHNTYISNICVASDYPHFLASTTAAGDIQLTDLRSPHHDRVRVHKSRLPSRDLAYLPHTRTFLITSDAAGNSEPHGTSLSLVMGLDLRHFYRTGALVKLPEMQGIATGIAVSTLHPHVLMSNAAGQVFTTNILRRVLPRYAKGPSAQGHMLKLFEIDWRAIETDSEPADSGMDGETGEAAGKGLVDAFHGQDVRSGVTRIHEGFKPVPIDLNSFGMDGADRRETGNKETRKKNNAASAASHQCIFPEEQSVVAMEWNQIPRFSTWAAIAWGSGLLWIGDLGHGDV